MGSQEIEAEADRLQKAEDQNKMRPLRGYQNKLRATASTRNVVAKKKE